MMMTSVCAAATTLALLLQSAAAATLRQSALPIPAARTRRLNTTTTNDGDLKFSEATFIASHNAHATLAVAEGVLEPLGANQDDTLIDQLTNDGVRGLLLDIMINEDEDEELRLVHGTSFVTLDYGGFRTAIGTNLIPFLEEDENAIITLFMETDGDDGADGATVRATILGHLQAIFSSMTVNGIAMKDMVFKYDHELWKDHEDWPRLDEIRQSGQRIFVITDRTELVDAEYGFMHNRAVIKENHFEGIDECESYYMWGSEKTSLPSNDYWSRLFFMNHFCCGSGPDSKGKTVGESLIGGGNNGWGILYNRVQQCISNNGGFKPNFIALDWVSQSEEAKQVRDFLNFGGRLGTGQACTDDLHCATSSCNIAMGVCQCQQCPYDSVDVCLGCETGQYCSPFYEGINVCQDKGGTQSNLPSVNLQPTEPPLSTIEGGSGSPTQNPTGNNAVNYFYCGEEYFTTVSGCNEAVKCPGGNDDCPDGQTCFAGVDCTLPPTIAPSEMPSDSPSSISAASQPSFIGFGDGAGTPAAANTNFCGTEFFDTLENCQDARPCPGPDGNDLCATLGVDFTCFSNVVCENEPSLTPGATVSTPDPPAEFWLSNLGLTKSPTGLETSPPTTRVTTAVPTSSTSLSPTGVPFDFSNNFFCGANFTDAQDNCYNNLPCPTQSPSGCGGGTCYGGITCSAPLTSLPTSTPTPGPTKSPQASPSNLSSNGSPEVQNQVYQTRSPFDVGSYMDSSGMVTSVNKVISGKFVLSIMIAIGFVGQLI